MRQYYLIGPLKLSGKGNIFLFIIISLWTTIGSRG